jgi:hypothetical protein
MLNGWLNGLLAGIQTLNQILTAGIAITAFSLFLYALSFNLRDRVARSFALILLCVVVVFTSETMGSNDAPLWTIDLFLRVQWIGIVFLPAAYLHLSDALLVTAGRPSRGRRRLAVRLMYVVSSGFMVLLSLGVLLGPLIPDGEPAPHLQRTIWTELFTVFYLVSMLWAGINFLRAYRRMLTRSGRRRMLYLMAGATAPALGSYPFLLYGSDISAGHPYLFWASVLAINFLVGGLVVVMAYAVAFFGVSWPDRVVKSRLFKWIMRGPVTASLALGMMTIVRRAGELFGLPYSVAVPAVMVGTVLLMEHIITLAAPLWERWLFYGSDRQQLVLLQNIEERLLTQSDLRQFLDAILAAVRDHLQAPCAFIAAMNEDELSLIVIAGNRSLLNQENLSDALEVIDPLNGNGGQEYAWGNFWLLPLRSRPDNLDRDETPPLLGLLGVTRQPEHTLDRDQRTALALLADRAALALEDRLVQQNVFRALEDLQPQAELLQRMRAASRYDSRHNLLDESLAGGTGMADWVKDALSHYWGGPKLTKSPLMNLQIVRKAADEYDGNMPNALRAVLRQAVEQIRPEGERRFTTEWILYNILELKFIQGQKVRDVATRLAMSEADLYRKQRVAIEAVARAILNMEGQAEEEMEGKEVLQF